MATEDPSASELRGRDAASPLVSLADYERAAEGLMEPGAHGYAFGGAGDEITLADNLASWRRLAIRPRTLVGVGRRDPSVILLGKPRPHPLIIAPMAFQRLAHRDGEIATAQAAAATDTIMCLSTLGTTGAQELAAAVPGAPSWFQLCVFADLVVTRALVAVAAQEGYEALVVTVDLPVFGVRERDLRSGQAANVALVKSAVAAGASGAMTPADFATLLDPDLGWADIERFAAERPLP